MQRAKATFTKNHDPSLILLNFISPFSPPRQILPAYLQIPAPQFKIFMDSVVWAFKHTMRNVADIGLNVLLNLLQKFQSHDQAGSQFFQTYFLDLMQHIFSVVTDTSHTASESGWVGVVHCSTFYFTESRFSSLLA